MWWILTTSAIDIQTPCSRLSVRQGSHQIRHILTQHCPRLAQINRVAVGLWERNSRGSVELDQVAGRIGEIKSQRHTVIKRPANWQILVMAC